MCDTRCLKLKTNGVEYNSIDLSLTERTEGIILCDSRGTALPSA